MKLEAFAASQSTLNTVRYITLLDAGSSGTRIFVYKWDTVRGADKFKAPLKLDKVFPLPDESDAEVKPGIQHYQKVGSTMAEYLDPLLLRASDFLAGQADLNNYLVPIYLLATAGMRTAFKEVEEEERVRRRKQILNLAWERMGSFPHFDAGQPSNARVITGQTEGLLGWVANNYARGGEPTMGIFEIGGSSSQFAFVTEDGNYANKICLPSKPEGYNVYSRSWDGLGSVDAGRTLATKLAHIGNQLVNPCLPKFYTDAVPGMVGTGNFGDCMEKASHILTDKGELGIPHYIEGTPLVGISVPMYSYQFFSGLKDTPGFKINEPYNHQLYSNAVRDYCNNDANIIRDNRPIDIILDTCFAASWTLQLLHNNSGFAMPTDNRGPGFLTFPHKGEPDLMTSSSWTLGAAALVARHDGLIGCPGSESLPSVPFHNSTRLGEVDWPPIFLPSDSVGIISSAESANRDRIADGWPPIFPSSNPTLHHVTTISLGNVQVGVSDSNCRTFIMHLSNISYVSTFTIIVIAMVVFIYRWPRTSLAVSKSAFPTDMKTSVV